MQSHFQQLLLLLAYKLKNNSCIKWIVTIHRKNAQSERTLAWPSPAKSRWNKPRKSMDSGTCTVVLRHIRVRTTTKTLLLTQFPHDLHSLVVSCRCLKISGSFLSVGFPKHCCLLAYLYSVDHYICSYLVLLTYLKLLPVFSFYLYHFCYRFWVFCLTDFYLSLLFQILSCTNYRIW